MKRILVYVALALIAAVTLTGCEVVLNFIFEPNLAVEYVNLVTPDGNFAGLEFEVRNEGAAVDNVEYEVVLAADQFNEFSFITVFRDDFDIGFKDGKQVTVGFERDIKPFVGDMVIEPGTYFVGVVVDTGNDVDESDEDDNLEFAFEPFLIDPESDGPPLPGDLALDDFENNNSPDQPATFTKGLEVWHLANLHSVDDHDWYQVNQPNPMTVGLYIKTRPGPDPDTSIDFYLEVINMNDPTMSPIYFDGPFRNHEVYIPMEPAVMVSQDWLVHVWSDSGQVGYYEIEAYDW